GTIRLSGGRSRVTQASAPSRSTRTKPGARAMPGLVAGHARIDRSRPLVQAAREIHGPEALLAEEIGDRRAAHSVMAVDDDLVGGIELGGPELDLLDRDVGRVLEPTQRGLPLVTHVEEHDRIVAVEPSLEVLRADVGHAGSPVANISTSGL